MSKKDLNTALRSLASSVSELRSEYQDSEGEHARTVAGYFVRLCLAIADGAKLQEAAGTDWRDWAVKQAAGFGKRSDDGTFGDPSPATVYRYRNAGVVAAMLGDAGPNPDPVAIPEGTTYLALVPWYRLYAGQTTDEGREKATAQIRSEWAKLIGKGTPTEERSKQAVEVIASRGTRGKQGTDAKGRAAKQDAKNKRSRNTPTETTETEPNTATVTVDPAALESLGKTVAAFVRKAAKDHNIPTTAVQSIMLGTCRLAKEHGAEMVVASLGSK